MVDIGMSICISYFGLKVSLPFQGLSSPSLSPKMAAGYRRKPRYLHATGRGFYVLLPSSFGLHWLQMRWTYPVALGDLLWDPWFELSFLFSLHEVITWWTHQWALYPFSTFPLWYVGDLDSHLCRVVHGELTGSGGTISALPYLFNKYLLSTY